VSYRGEGILKLLDKTLLVLSKCLSDEPGYCLAAVEEDISGYIVAGEYNSVELRILNKYVGDIADCKKPSDSFFKYGNINGISKIVFLLEVSVGLMFLLSPKKIYYGVMLLLLQVGRFYLLYYLDAVEVL
jgi:hypothetical protein